MFVSVRWPCVIVGLVCEPTALVNNNNNSPLMRVFFISFSSQLLFASDSVEYVKVIYFIGVQILETNSYHTVNNAYFMVSGVKAIPI